jgi:NAD-dependent dihydropyrimidine dehydrogenase PreA subunit
MSNVKEGIFVGGDVRRIGFASEAMRDGRDAAESIDRYIRGEDLKAGRKEKTYETASIPKRVRYKLQPEAKWIPAKERMNFEPFELRITPEEMIREAKRCLYCGPCMSCKGCVEMGLQEEISEITVDEDLCSGCGVCVAICPYDASTLEKKDGKIKSAIDDMKCKRCGVCISACPSNARSIKDALSETIKNTYSELYR